MTLKRGKKKGSCNNVHKKTRDQIKKIFSCLTLKGFAQGRYSKQL